MPIPILLSALGSMAAGAGMLGTMSPLVAGALGSGIGAYLGSGDLKEGLKSGLLSYGIGGLAGGAFGANSGASALKPGALAANAANSAAKPGVLNEILNLPAGITPVPAVQGATMMREGLSQGLMTKAGLGAMVGSGMATPQPTMPVQAKRDFPEAEPLQMKYQAPPPGYVSGRDAEHMYFSNPRYFGMKGGGVVTDGTSIRPSKGGIGDMGPPEMGHISDKQVIIGAIAAARGELPQEEAAMALALFVRTYGEDEFRELIEAVEAGDPIVPENIGAGDEVQPMAYGGMVRGGGHGMSDAVPASGPGARYQLSDGEFVVPADVVSGLGNGSTDAGARELMRMQSRVRKARTGSAKQAPTISAAAQLPA